MSCEHHGPMRGDTVQLRHTDSQIGPEEIPHLRILGHASSNPQLKIQTYDAPKTLIHLPLEIRPHFHGAPSSAVSPTKPEVRLCSAWSEHLLRVCGPCTEVRDIPYLSGSKIQDGTRFT